jgi:acyl transferase domain-containing protein
LFQAFAKIAERITYSQPKMPIISTTNKELIAEEVANAEYWCHHLQQSAVMVDEIEALADERIVLAMGSKPASIAQKVKVCLSSFDREQKEWQEMLSSLGALFVRGIAIDWDAFDRDYSRQRLQLPTYPFQRQRYWFKTTDREHDEQRSRASPDSKYKETRQIA